jgi:16S rRNA (guanine966-N2)-methyltransferase
MRIVAGIARGRPLAAPPGSGTRPTSDKVRAAIFNVLGQFFDGGDVLDLYAGTGALALEALSRGASRATCVEEDRRVVEVLRRNAAACGFSDVVEVRIERVDRALPALAGRGFSLAFLDPPYAVGPGPALSMLAPCLSRGALAVGEHDARETPPDRPPGLALVDRRRYGTTGISIYRRE